MAEADDRAAVEYAKCAADCAYFIDSYGVIDDAQGHGDGGGTMPFRLWPAQIDLAWALMTERRVLILKARQLGISWLCCAYALWLCLFAPGKVVLLFSQGEVEALELLRRVKALYTRLPAWLRDAVPAIARDNTTECGWSNGSHVRSLPATQKSGRSFTASLVILDEAAHLQWADQLYTALKPTIDGGGQLVVLSTANGIGNLFHRLWTRAVQRLNAFRPIFLPWWARPGRDADWYARQVAEAAQPALVKQEYPSTATEAFLVSGRTRFSPEWIEAQAPNVREGLPRSAWPGPLLDVPGLTVHALPTGRPCTIGADVAEGLERGDYSAAVLIDDRTWEELACLHGHWEPDEFAGHLRALAEVYGAWIAPERNNHGHAVLLALKLAGAKVAPGHDRKRGWLTNFQTKPQAIDLLATALRDGLAVVRTQATLDELRIYTVLADGKTSAPEGYHDDRVMAWAIALAAIQLGHRPTYKVF